MCRIRDLCVELDTLNGNLAFLVQSELRCVERPVPGPGPIIATEKKILDVARSLGNVLTCGDPSSLREYVEQLFASKQRCDRAGISLGNMLVITRS